MRWSTPLREYRAFGSHRAAGRGEGRGHVSGGEYADIELELLAIDYTCRLTRRL